jgi:hypothetical protein
MVNLFQREVHTLFGNRDLRFQSELGIKEEYSYF